MNQFNLNSFISILIKKWNLSIFDKFEIFFQLIITVCTLAIILSVLNKFIEIPSKIKAKKEKKSVVETGSMAIFFLAYYFIIRLKIGYIYLSSFPLNFFLELIGTLIILIGTYVNVKGRSILGKAWANQIKIYKNHKLITTGIYKYLRHPLYASLIWIGFGGGLIFTNLYAILINILIFIPFMYLRAKQEEKLLEEFFPNYSSYRKKVGMFFPKL